MEPFACCISLFHRSLHGNVKNLAITQIFRPSLKEFGVETGSAHAGHHIVASLALCSICSLSCASTLRHRPLATHCRRLFARSLGVFISLEVLICPSISIVTSVNKPSPCRMSITDTDTLVANIMAQAVKDTIRRLEVIVATYTDTSSDSARTSGSNKTDDSRDATRHLRAWFKNNLDHPYPSLSLRQRFASELGVPVRNINAQFTNWRRRTGWSHIRKAWAGNSHQGMVLLLSRYASGEEARPDVRAAIRRMAEYLEEDPARQWIGSILSTRAEGLSSPTSRSSSLTLVSYQLGTPRFSTRSPSLDSSADVARHAADTEVVVDHRSFVSVSQSEAEHTPGSLTQPTRKRRRSIPPTDSELRITRKQQ
ncbi:hypothetical protein CC85DRAFT_175080 [Cutaneotrichosporon oleaginosum]|uniref:SXI1 n=1 Tax=Cutaneotrichosporon oleaginosum TaxID=879819 RepID=A0A0J0XFN8_9TREE|nr:uncharacterized protein CC85DRAFT_175080 [Cutaneotrichosporon oleaginosum]AKN79248.1 SXI1 [Cutaneotrichosporon oleaginosum]AKN79249.1 SXI1 [Cutaneotrichosporon oleaginosum]KLT39883.1 hypothetical protein CC85DRAFT_175080 [Cutaneotrichosporon oleaginosum]